MACLLPYRADMPRRTHKGPTTRSPRRVVPGGRDAYEALANLQRRGTTQHRAKFSVEPSGLGRRTARARGILTSLTTHADARSARPIDARKGRVNNER